MKICGDLISVRLNTKICIYDSKAESFTHHWAEVMPVYNYSGFGKSRLGDYIITIRKPCDFRVDLKSKIKIYDQHTLFIHDIIVPNGRSRYIQIIASMRGFNFINKSRKRTRMVVRKAGGRK